MLLPHRSSNPRKTGQPQGRSAPRRFLPHSLSHPPGSTGALKCVKVVMEPANLDEFRDALAEVGVAGMTVSEAKAFEQTSPRRKVYLGGSYVVDFTSKIEVIIVVRKDVVPMILDVLGGLSALGEQHYVSVFISDIVEAVRIRTGDRGEEAFHHDFHPGLAR